MRLDELDEVVGLGVALVDLELVLAGDVDSLLRIDRRVDAGADDLGRAAIEGHHRRRVVLIAGDHLIVARAHDMHGAARRIDLVLVAIGRRRDAQINGALGQRGDKGLIVDIGNVEFGGAIHVEAAGAHVDCRMRARLGPEGSCRRSPDS